AGQLLSSILCSASAGWIHEPHDVRVRPAGQLWWIRTRGLPANELNACERRDSTASRTAHRPDLETFFVTRSRRQNRLRDLREPAQILWIQRCPLVPPPIPVRQEFERRRQRNLTPATSVSRPAAALVVPVLRRAGSSAVYGRSHPCSRRRDGSELQRCHDPALWPG